MKKYTSYVGLDVHADSISVAVCDAKGGAVRSLGNVAHNIGALAKLLRKHIDLERASICYEAGPTGYVLYWELSELGADCVVIAPSLIPRKPGDKVKTDRRDAEKLARLLRAGELTPVWVPKPEHEALRDLVRARGACRKDLRKAQQRVEKFLLRHGHRPPPTTKGKKAGTKRIKAFGQHYWRWLDSLQFTPAAAQLTFADYKAEAAHQTTRLARLENEIVEAIKSAPESVQELVASLQALRGVAFTTAVTLAAEVGDFSRFSKPTQLMAWAGVVPSESSTGGPGKSKRFGITKTGNSHVRHVLGEAAWAYRFSASGTSAVSRRRILLPAALTAIAEKADARLHGRYMRLSAANKPNTKITIAIARELLGFAWAIANHSAPSKNGVRSSGWKALLEG